MNKLEEIYKELGKDICLFPYFGGFYQTNNVYGPNPSINSVKPCSVIQDDSSQWKIIDSKSIIESRNTSAWKELRKNFSKGSCHDCEDCKVCSIAEKNGGHSARQLNNQYFAEHLNVDIINEVKNIINNDFNSDKILSLDYFPSNYCTYECVMCTGASSTARLTFENKISMYKDRVHVNEVDYDFDQVLEHVEIINFTGGETILQKEVHRLIDRLIEKNLSKKITISLLTNASKYPTDLLDKFTQFKDVFYTASVDGVGDVIEYQRRNAKWETVNENVVKYYKNYGSTINYVLTCINVFSFLDFIDWLNLNNIKKRVFVSMVFYHDDLSLRTIPLDLKQQIKNKLTERKHLYAEEYQELIDRVLQILDSQEHDPTLIDKFKQRIQKEDTVSKKSLVDVVPEWKEYFND